MDISLFQTIAPVGGTLIRKETTEEGTRVLVVLDRPVVSIFSVSVRGKSALEISLASETSVWITVPSHIATFPLEEMDLEILAQVESGSAEGVAPLYMGFSRPPGMVDGEAQAIQEALRTLAMTPGTDLNHPDRGGGLRDLRKMTLADTSAVARKASIAVQRFNAYQSKSRHQRGRIRVSRAEVESVQLLSKGTAAFQFGVRRLLGDSVATSRSADLAKESFVLLTIRFILQGRTGTREATSSVIL